MSVRNFTWSPCLQTAMKSRFVLSGPLAAISTNLADWLKEVGVSTVAMESTGVYWIPVFEILEARGFEVLLVNARDVKTVPGRKTDVNDAQWLQQLHQYGLLRGSFRPRRGGPSARVPSPPRAGVEYAASTSQHMQKALMQMNVQLHHVVTDITGLTGMRIIRAIVSGNQVPEELAELRDATMRVLRRNNPSRRLPATTAPSTSSPSASPWSLYDFHQAKIAECDVEIEAVLRTLNEERTTPEEPLPTGSTLQGIKPAEVRCCAPRFTACSGADLTQIHGFGPYTVLRLVAECGDDMSKWPTDKHFTSWLSLAPGNKISGGRVLSSKTRRSIEPRCRAAHGSPRSTSVERRRRSAPSTDASPRESERQRLSQRPPGSLRFSSTRPSASAWRTWIRELTTTRSAIASGWSTTSIVARAAWALCLWQTTRSSVEFLRNPRP